MKTLSSPLAIAALALGAHGAFAADVGSTAADGPPAIEKVVVRSNARFDFDRSDVKTDDQQKILAELGAAGQVTWQSVNAVGYTDSIGTPDYNQALSERRAQAIKSYLVGKGVAPDMIVTMGRGADDPLASNEDAAGRAQNRRTAIEFQGVRSTVR